ncbi:MULTISPECIES: hypothetical protein [unclassified Cryobacterium]|uniref:hypothetical protein n=1 Tax=unclassified Cryobacterium TaxID=2649013 RepID=UPI002AB32DB2|nr:MULTISPECIES: hypothetical protein [unclassified Cryobacterium]MDY7528483.1 hypothetical protein [Cryobacterium sp. 10C2]MDY7555772.1 hypothetical protein [Cryobacterium sp. 10C3]MEB0286194.1 hypothetical protein [Cryobacterium sp. 10S3]MEB0289203.1 hypothetical protein [Cryobacterium sp. 10C2]WPX12252.1 hypothetical protein RHM57_11215 [Cryobacterium sp. 10S3]
MANAERIAELSAEAGIRSNAELALFVGVDKGTLSRVLSGASAAGPQFQGSFLTAFPVKFEEVFEIVERAAGKAVA